MAPVAPERFSSAMTSWFQNHHYRVGIVPQDLNQEQDVKRGEKFVEIARELVSVGMPLQVSSGASSEQLFHALVPFLPLSQLVGLKVTLDVTTLIVVVHADALTEAATRERLERLTQLAEPLAHVGLRLNGQGFGVYLRPLLVYFEPARYDERVSALLSSSMQSKYRQKVYLKTGFVNVAGAAVRWPEATGLARFGKALLQSFGAKGEVFDTQDLQAVITLASL